MSDNTLTAVMIVGSLVYVILMVAGDDVAKIIRAFRGEK